VKECVVNFNHQKYKEDKQVLQWQRFYMHT